MSFSFRRLERRDFGLLAAWLAEPHVHRWWHHEFSAEAMERDFGPGVDGDEPGEDWLAVHDGSPVGLLQFSYFADYPDEVAEMAGCYPVGAGAGTVDYLLGDPAQVGAGVGSAMIAAFVAGLWAREPDLTHLVVPVASANVASWRALEKAGFTRVARGMLVPDNPIDDGWHEICRLERPDDG